MLQNYPEILKRISHRNSLEVQWLEFCTFTAMGLKVQSLSGNWDLTSHMAQPKKNKKEDKPQFQEVVILHCEVLNCIYLEELVQLYE